MAASVFAILPIFKVNWPWALRVVSVLVAVGLTVFALLYREFTGHRIDDVVGQHLASFVCAYFPNSWCDPTKLTDAKAKQEAEEARFREIQTRVQARQQAEEARLREIQARAQEQQQAEEIRRREIQKRVQAVAEAEAIRETEARTINFQLQNSYPQRIFFEFSSDQGDYWPGNGQAYYLDSGGTVTYSLRCTEAFQNICYGAWSVGILNAAWGKGQQRQLKCNSCCAPCGGGTFHVNFGQ